MRPLVRPVTGRRVAGVAAAIGNSFGIDPNLVRVAFVILTFASGIGLLGYVACWLLMPSAEAAEPEPPREAGPITRWNLAQAVALAAIVLGIVLLVQPFRFLFADAVVWPVTLAGFGVALLWGRFRSRDPQSESADHPQAAAAGTDAETAAQRVSPWSAAVTTLLGDVNRPATIARVVAGSVLVVSAGGVFLAANDSGAAVRQVTATILVFTIGVALVLGPWLSRMAGELAEERRERIRSQERADVAAHLHDSVLHTLALVGRSADDPRRVVGLVRSQERELRAWLAGGTATPTSSLAAAIDDAAGSVETDYGVPIEVVKVGDCAVDPQIDALVRAAREAMVNASRHSGAPSISVYVEVEDGCVTIYVRDRGVGFDDTAVDLDRRGIADSIVGRMQRHGGKAQIRSDGASGTDVELTMPRSAGPKHPVPPKTPS
ncbi:MAG: putative signal transduction histidine kinase [Actinomycetia bacterium]|nr:putative signal transduction histidine kinase [Actinomycetes bacterium]